MTPAVLWMLLGLTATQVPSPTEQQAAVVSGETLAFGASRIQLADVLAPSAAQRCAFVGSSPACGAISRRALQSLIQGRHVTCQPLAVHRSPWVGTADVVLARCWAGGFDLAQALVAEGLAVPAQDGLAACVERRGALGGFVREPLDLQGAPGRR
jgi:endonuclease YncB( thermonuclease family)